MSGTDSSHETALLEWMDYRGPTINNQLVGVDVDD